MFPHVVTVINSAKIKDKLTLKSCTVEDVFFYNQKIIAQENSGEKYSNTYHCIFSEASIEKYLKPKVYNLQDEHFTLEENKTIIIKGIVDISNLDDLENVDNWFYVKTISDNSDYGEELKNIEVTN